MKVIELKDTISMMNSSDYKERFKAEYYQLAIRYRRLKAMLELWDNGKLDFEPTCSRSTYDIQIKAMSEYIGCLKTRALMEDIILKEVE